MRGEIDKGYLWNPADAGYAMVAVAKQMLDGKAVTDGVNVKGLGDAEIDTEKRVVKFNKILEVDKTNARQLGFYLSVNFDKFVNVLLITSNNFGVVQFYPMIYGNSYVWYSFHYPQERVKTFWLSESLGWY